VGLSIRSLLRLGKKVTQVSGARVLRTTKAGHPNKSPHSFLRAVWLARSARGAPNGSRLLDQPEGVGPASRSGRGRATKAWRQESVEPFRTLLSGTAYPAVYRTGVPKETPVYISQEMKSPNIVNSSAF
jgi:hypothetical protein